MSLYDCSHRIETGMTVYPGDPDVSVAPQATIDDHDCRVSQLALGSHAGTHVDAPSHTESAGRSLDEFDVDMFRFDARLVDVRDFGARDAIPPDRLPDTDCDLLVFHTGWDDHWNTDRYVDHPYLAPETAARCADAGCHVAVDALNVDPTPSENAADDEPAGFRAHHELLGNDCLILENLTGLDRLPERFTLHAYPLALGVDGAPVRAVAETDE